RMINFYGMPKQVNPGDLQSLGDYVIFFRKIDPDMAKRRINTQRKLHHANLYKAMRNLESEASYLEAEEMTQNLMMGEEMMFETEGWFLIKGSSLNELNLKASELI